MDTYIESLQKLVITSKPKHFTKRKKKRIQKSSITASLWPLHKSLKTLSYSCATIGVIFNLLSLDYGEYFKVLHPSSLNLPRSSENPSAIVLMHCNSLSVQHECLCKETSLTTPMIMADIFLLRWRAHNYNNFNLTKANMLFSFTTGNGKPLQSP